MKWNGQKSPKICKWSDYKQMRWNEVQWKGQQAGKMIHIEILKSAKKGKQRDRRRSWRNKMLQKKERKFWNKVKTRKVNGMDDIKCTEMDQTSPSWSSLKSQDFIAFSERKNLKSENEMEHTLWKGYMIKSNAIERKKKSKWSDYTKVYWDEMRCSEKRSAGDESSISGEHTSALLGVRQYNTRDTEKIQESPHDVLLSFLPSERGPATSRAVIYWCCSSPSHPTNSPFQTWHDSQYKIHFFLN